MTDVVGIPRAELDADGCFPKRPCPAWFHWAGHVYFRCPHCRKISSLPHDIDDAGNVSPSVVCPRPGCKWHVHARLLDWRADAQDRIKG